MKDSYLIKKMKEFIKDNKPILIFTPTIYECENLYNRIQRIVPGGYYVHSKLKQRSLIIKKFRANQYKYLFTTAVLERGVTIRNLQVIVYNADNPLYDEHALVQIAGRVGRKYDAPDGEVIFIATKISDAMEQAKRTIESKNKSL